MLYLNAQTSVSLNNSHTFTFSYLFENSSIYILQIKNNNLPMEDLSELHQWLIIDKSNSKINQLNLKFADSSSAVEERYFEQGYLKFTSTTANFIEKYNSAQHTLKHIHSLVLPDIIQKAIENHIKI